MPHTELKYLSNAPKSLPISVFPIELGGVRSDITDLCLKYDEAAKSLYVLIVPAEGTETDPVNPGATFDDLVVGLVDHVSFELGFPLQSPALISYIDPHGSVTVYAKPFTVVCSIGGIVLLDLNELKTKLSAMVPVSNLLQEYNAAVHIDNPVQQFVALWGVLGYIAGRDEVKKVNTLLQTLGVGDEPIAGPYGLETKYTRVRSEIAHPVKRNVRLANLPARVNEVLPEFRQVVKKAVAAHVGLP